MTGVSRADRVAVALRVSFREASTDGFWGVAHLQGEPWHLRVKFSPERDTRRARRSSEVKPVADKLKKTLKLEDIEVARVSVRELRGKVNSFDCDPDPTDPCQVVCDPDPDDPCT